MLQESIGSNGLAELSWEMGPFFPAGPIYELSFIGMDGIHGPTYPV